MMPESEQIIISFSGQITFEDFERAQKLQASAAKGGGKLRNLGKIPTAFAVVVIVVAVLALIPMVSLRAISSMSPVIGILVFMSIIFFISKLGGKRQLRKAWEQQEHKLDKMAGSVNANGIVFHMNHCTSEMKWPYFSGYDEDGTVLILNDSKLVFHLIPRAAFHSEEDWREVLSILAGNLPRNRALEIDKEEMPAANCSVCGGGFPKKAMIELGGKWSCAACKDIAAQKLREGVS